MCLVSQALSRIAVEKLVPVDVWVLAILLKEQLQTAAVERLITRRAPKIPAHSSLFGDAIRGSGVALTSVFKSLLRSARRRA